jgi:RIO kinase 1
MKIPERLEPLVEQGIVQEVVRPLMSGKEASLFVVVADDVYCVAKVYKDAEHRSFRNRAGYTEGRAVRNSRQRRAIEKGSKFGKEQMEASWQNAEVDALYRLHAAGLRVPKPRLFSDGVLLMDLILDPDGEPAPRLFDVDIPAEEAPALHRFLLHQVVLMLCAGMVHGDLSECNVLIAWDGPVIIDLPQATDAAGNPNARSLFLRDVANLTNYLAKFEPSLAATRYGPEIWSLYERALLFPDTPLTGKFKGSDRKADTTAVLGEIETAARDAMRKHELDGEGPRKTRQAAAAANRARDPRGDARPPRSDARGQRSDPRGPRPEARGPRPEPRGPRPDRRPELAVAPQRWTKPPEDLEGIDLDALLLEDPDDRR